MHNRARFETGAQPLTMVHRLNQAALNHACWLALNRIMSHGEEPDTAAFTGATFVERIKGENYHIMTGGENIAAGQRSVQDVMDRWLASPEHRGNILNHEFWNIGCAYSVDAYGHLYWCVVYATPLTHENMRKIRVTRLQVNVCLPRAIVSEG
jgi:uncharacterized protein YkwD